MTKCTWDKRDRPVWRWENAEVLKDIKARMEREAGKLALRKGSVKYPFGIIKRIFNQGYLLPYGAQVT